MRRAVIVAALAARRRLRRGGRRAPRAGRQRLPVSIDAQVRAPRPSIRRERVVTVELQRSGLRPRARRQPVGVRRFQGGIDVTERRRAQDSSPASSPRSSAPRPRFREDRPLRPDLILAVYSGLNSATTARCRGRATVAQTNGTGLRRAVAGAAKVSSRALRPGGAGHDVVDSVEDEFAKAARSTPSPTAAPSPFASASAAPSTCLGPPEACAARFFERSASKRRRDREARRATASSQLSEEPLRCSTRTCSWSTAARRTSRASHCSSGSTPFREGRVIYIDVDGDFATRRLRQLQLEHPVRARRSGAAAFHGSRRQVQSRLDARPDR